MSRDRWSWPRFFAFALLGQAFHVAVHSRSPAEAPAWLIAAAVLWLIAEVRFMHRNLREHWRHEQIVRAATPPGMRRGRTHA